MKRSAGEPHLSGAAEHWRASRQVGWLMSLRVVIVTTLLLSALLVQAITDTIFVELNPIYYLVGFTYLLTLVYAAIQSLARWGRWFIQLQLVGDLLIITGLIYYSGGLDSAFPFLYILTIITASILLLRRGGLMMALAACVLYGTLVVLIYLNLMPPAKGFLTPPATLTMNQVYYNLFVRWIGFVAAALLSSYLAEKLRETGETLEARSADLANLQVFYEDIINSLNSGLLTTDLEGRILSVNVAAEKLLGRDFGSLRNRRVEEVLGLDEEAKRRLLSVSPDGSRVELRFQTPEGARHLGFSVSRLYDRGNLLRGHTHVIQDLTKLKELEREVRLKERMAAVGEMAAGMAHEIRNPLASMSGSIQMLRGELREDEEGAALMGIVLRESERLNRIIEEFLSYAKPAPPLPQLIDLGRLVEETVTLFRNSPELRATHSVEASIAGSDRRIAADPDQIRQVLWNLLRNAVQAMPGGGRARVLVGPVDELGVELSVEDEGPGFTDDETELLWQPFHTSEKGSGLGLAIVYRIVRDHAGRVSVGNRSSGGARVRVWLPRSGPVDTASYPGIDRGATQEVT